MKKIYYLISMLFMAGVVYAANDPALFKTLLVTDSQKIGGSGTANSKAALEINSTTKGFLPPRMTSTQRDAISSPPQGLMIFNTTTGLPSYNDGSNWRQIASLDGADPLSNKTLVSPEANKILFTEASAPGTPAVGTLAVYAKTDHKLYRKTSTGTEVEIGGTSSAFSPMANNSALQAENSTATANIDLIKLNASNVIAIGPEPGSSFGIKLDSTGVIPDATTGTMALGSSSKVWSAGHFADLKLYGSSSGVATISAANTTTSYSVKWPSAQGSTGQVLQNDGSGNLTWATATGGANTTLSNLGTTAINSNLIFDFTHPNIPTIQTKDGQGQTPSSLNIHTGQPAVDVNSGDMQIFTWYATGTGNSGDIAIYSDDVEEGVSGDIDIQTGDASHVSPGDGIAGDINLMVGYAVNSDGSDIYMQAGESINAIGGNIILHAGDGPTRGKIQINDGTEGTADHVLKSTDTDGSASWGYILNANIDAAASIVDTKLATISTAGKVSNSATTATNSNTASAIVARDGSGNFSAGTISAALSGNVTGNVTGQLTANNNIILSSNYLSNDGGSEGVAVDNSGGVTLKHSSDAPSLTAALSSTQFSITGGNRSISGTNTTGGAVYLNAGLGTGNGASEVSIWVPRWKGSGTTAQDSLGRALTISSVSTTASLVSVQDTMTVGAASGKTGTIGLLGTTSGTVTIQPQDSAGTYNFNLPTTAGSSGDVLSSGGGGSTAMSWLTPASANTASAIVKRDSSGDFAAGAATLTSLKINGSSSGTATINAANTTTSYSVKWPSAQGGANTTLQNDGSGNLTWAAGATITAWTSYTPTFTGFGSESSVNARWRQVGGSLEVMVTFTAGTPTSTEARISFPSTGSPVAASWLPTLSICGKGARATSAALDYIVLCEAGVSYFTFGIQGGSTGGIVKRNADGFVAASQVHSYFMSVPIESW